MAVGAHASFIIFNSLLLGRIETQLRLDLSALSANDHIRTYTPMHILTAGFHIPYYFFVVFPAMTNGVMRAA